MTISNKTIALRIQEDIINEFTKTIEMFDLTPSEARLFATLYLYGEPMTLDEMSEALGKSKTSMSTGIRTLLDQKLVERVWKKGERKDYYKADEALYKKFMSNYTQRWLELTIRQKEALSKIKHHIETSQVKGDQDFGHFIEKIQDMIEFHDSLEEVFKGIAKKG
ncbi:MarR family transcriptional regulator [Bacillaceae bacterium S4-13-58]